MSENSSDRQRRDADLLRTLAHSTASDPELGWPGAATMEEARKYLTRYPEPPPDRSLATAYEKLHEQLEAWIDDQLERGASGERIKREALGVIRRYQEGNIPLEDRRRSVKLELSADLRQNFQPTHLSTLTTEGRTT